MLDRSPQFLRTPALPGPEQKLVFAERRLREAILWCEIAPGSLVTESALGDRFQLGKAAVRTALARLAGRGMVDPVSRRGWRVRPITGAFIGSLIQARRLAEPMLAESVPLPPELGRAGDLVPVIQAMRHRAEPQSVAAARRYDRELLALLSCRANPFLQGWLHELWDHAEWTTRFLEGRGGQRLAVADPAPLVTAFQAGDRERIRIERLKAVDAFESFAARVLLSDPAEIGSSGLEPVPKERHGDKKGPHAADGSAHSIFRGKGAYS